MTTLTVDPDLYEHAREAATAQGKTVDEFVRDAVRTAVSAAGVRRTWRNGLPVMTVDAGESQVDLDEVRQSIEEEGVVT